MKTFAKDSCRGLRIYAIAVSALTLVAILLRCLNLFFFFDRDIGYYTSHSILPLTETVLLVGSALFMAAYTPVFFRRVPLSYGDAPKPVLRIAVLVGVALTLCFTVIRVMTGEDASLLLRLLLVLSVIAAVYLLLHASREEVPPLPRFITGLAMIFFLLLALASSYFDVTVQMNAPDKLLFQLGCLAGMIFTVSELRLLIGKPRPALYLFSLGAAVLFLGVSSVPTLIGGMSGAIEKSSWFWCSLPMAGTFLYVLTRLFCLQIAPPEEPTLEESESEATGEAQISSEDNAEEKEPTEKSDSPS